MGRPPASVLADGLQTASGSIPIVIVSDVSRIQPGV
jgi:hypothetical protein